MWMRGSSLPWDEAEALLYDWHNSYRLRTQRADVGYFLAAARNASRPLVLGAGTGRVAVPLARFAACPGARTTAIDVSEGRLRRIATTQGLSVIRADMRQLPLVRGFDLVLLPYSTLQLLNSAEDRDRALAETARVLESGGLIYIDVSTSFGMRSTVDWHVILKAPCEELGYTVIEWERCIVYSDHVIIEKSFRTEDDGRILDVLDRWVFSEALALESALDQAGFDLVAVDQGYGDVSSWHRQIVRARRRRTG